MASKPNTTTAGEPVVFISSTSEDLRAFRAAAEHAAKLAGFRPEMMEYFGASGRPSLDECLERVSRAHVVVAITAHRYGWIPEGQPPPGGKSITWLECGHADSNGTDILPHILDDKSAWPAEQRDQHRLDRALQQGTATSELLAEVQRDLTGLRDFKAWLGARPRATFSSPEDLEIGVLDALHKWRARHPEFAPVPQPERAAALDRRALQPYLRLLVSRVTHLPLRGIDIGASDAVGEPRRVELSNVYVGLETTTVEEEERGAPEGRSIRGKRQTTGSPDTPERAPLSALAATVKHRRLVILGDPGSGKSTFVNHLALCLAQHLLAPDEGWLARLPGWPDAGVPLVPVLVTLRDFALAADAASKPAGASDLWAFLEGQLERDQLAEAGGALEHALDAGRAFVLLDGLDEVTGMDRRPFVHSAVAAFMERYKECRYLVTCRTLAYQDARLHVADVPSFQLAPFDRNAIGRFIDAWYGELRRLHVIPAQREPELAGALRGAVRRPDLARLAPNPLLLTVMALVNTHKGVLPDARAQLYEDTVDLLLWRWEQVKAGSEAGALRLLLDHAGCKDVDLKQALWALAFEAHRDGGASGDDEKLADIGEHRLEKALARLHPADSRDWARELVEVIRSRAGLLIERAPEVFTFPHRTFQEYLAGAHLASGANFATEGAALFARDPFWRTAILLGVGRLTYVSGEIDRPLALAAELCPARAPGDETGWRQAWLAGEVLEEIGVARVGRSALGRDLLDRVPRRLGDLLREGCLTVVERAAAGDTLGRLGDPRFRGDRWWLPDEEWLGFIKVEAGPFTMGSDPRLDLNARDQEQPQHVVELPEFYVARYPVTVAQFRAFVEDAKFQVGDPDCLRGVPNHPVVRVAFHEALAYCRWLTDKLRSRESTPLPLRDRLREGWVITLPSEAEWEKAARGQDARIYPWGNEFSASKTNGYETGLGTTSAVGLFPDGASPCGALDMSGNVWEWTRSLWGKDFDKAARAYPYNPRDAKREDLEASDTNLRVVRGGSFNGSEVFLRAAYRGRNYPDDRNDNLGFRLVSSRLRP